MAGDRSDDLGVSSPGLPAHYEIRVDGVLDHRWAAWFGGLHVETDGTQTVISGLLADQPALHGLLARIRDLGLCLISVRRLPGSEAGTRLSHQTGAHPATGRQKGNSRCRPFHDPDPPRHPAGVSTI